MLVFIIHRKSFVPLKNSSCILINVPKTAKVMVTYKVGNLPHIDRIIKQDGGVNEPYITDVSHIT